ncbi:MAG TPA: M20/M25/M40 family metallo-hydrolase [Paludibaculum sp.]|jgi:acetylornithine deacetylase/succinyl-diaminopimelate desuccinylase-like protein
MALSGLLILLLLAPLASAQDWTAMEPETLRHFQAMVRLDSSGPPNYESKVAAYVKNTLEAAGIPVKVFAKDPLRPNVVARIRGNGKKRPILFMGHLDTVGVQPEKWTHPPFSATIDGGYIYGRGVIDDKQDVAAGLVLMLTLKRLNVPLDRDVIFLAESGEEGQVEWGIKYMVENHWAEIEAEFCIAEGGQATRQGAKGRSFNVATTEKVPVPIVLSVKGTAGHGSIPLADNAIGRLSKAVGRLADWQPPMRLNDTTRTYFERLGAISTPEQRARYNGLLDPAKTAASQEYLRLYEPAHNSMLRTSLSPNMIEGGYRVNVIPSTAKATVDIRALPDEEAESFRKELLRVIGDPSIVIDEQPMYRPKAPPSPLNSEAFRAIEAVQKRIYPELITIPYMVTGATDMSYLRAKGVPSYGVGPLVDLEDMAKGYGWHSDQERLLEKELYRYVRFVCETVRTLAAAQ